MPYTGSYWWSKHWELQRSVSYFNKSYYHPQFAFLFTLEKFQLQSVAGERSLPTLSLTCEPFVIFSLACIVDEGRGRATLVGTWHLAMVILWNHTLEFWFLVLCHGNTPEWSQSAQWGFVSWFLSLPKGKTWGSWVEK